MGQTYKEELYESLIIRLWTQLAQILIWTQIQLDE